MRRTLLRRAAARAADPILEHDWWRAQKSDDALGLVFKDYENPPAPASAPAPEALNDGGVLRAIEFWMDVVERKTLEANAARKSEIAELRRQVDKLEGQVSILLTLLQTKSATRRRAVKVCVPPMSHRLRPLIRPCVLAFTKAFAEARADLARIELRTST